MLLLAEVCAVEIVAVEAASWGVGDEIGSLSETEIMRVDAVDIIHDDPSVLTDNLPAVRGFMTDTFAIVIVLVHDIGAGALVGDSMTNGGATLMRDIEKVPLATGVDNVGVYDAVPHVGSGEEDLGLRCELGEIIVDIGIVDALLAGSETDGEMNHELTGLRVIDRLGCPDASDFGPLTAKLREVDICAGPGLEVMTLHEDKPAVVAPTELTTVSLPLSGSESVALPEDMEVGHGKIEVAVGAAEDVGVADALLLGNGVAGYDGLVIVERGESRAVEADSHVEAVVGILVVDHKIGAHLAFGLSRRASRHH